MKSRVERRLNTLDPKVSIIITHYQAEKELRKTLKFFSEIKKKKKSVEFIFVDNDETKIVGKKILKNYPWIKYYEAPTNLGFGGGCNFGRKKARGEYLLFLNSDISIDYRSFIILFTLLKKEKDVAIVSPKLVNISGKYYAQATNELTPLRGIFALSILNKIFPHNLFSNKYMMVDWDRSTSREVEVIQLGAFMIKSEVYDSVGGFDEKMFLYFEENDLSNKLRNVGWKLVYLPKAMVTHLEAKGTPKDSEKIKKVFAHSRFYYFKKHYGALSALVVEFFARLSKENVFFMIIFFVGTFLRFYRIENRFSFAGEMGSELLEMKNYVLSGKIPLLGPATSHPWLSFGPLYYWLAIPILILFNFNPLSLAYISAFFGSLLILLNYYIISALINKSSALISSLLIAISYSFIYITWGARFYSLVPFFFYPFLYFFTKYLNGNQKSIFWSALFFGVMLNFHYTPLILIPALVLLIYFKQKKLEPKSLGYGLVGLLITQIPLIIDNLLNRVDMLTKFIAWFPYRILIFLGLYPAENEVVISSGNSLISYYNFVMNSFSPPLKGVHIIILLSLILVAVYFLKFRKEIWRGDIVKTLFYFLILGSVGIFIHSNPPYHYFLPLYLIPILLVSIILSKFIEKRQLKYFAYLILSIITIVHVNYYFSNNWFYKQDEVVEGEYVPFSLQLEATDSIISDAGGSQFSLKRIGPNDQFEDDYAQNYIYLLWWKGKESKEGESLVYTINENRKNTESEQEIYSDGGLTVTKK